ncbi:MAG TPA: hypothetical protein VFE47_02560 [Tepidisphaeraceae bacterium]|jgi:hypothetical protein|nr:hypothetical protein [Tepidisphaeraceae bacterium]
MSNVSLRIPPTAPLADTLNEMPPSLRGVLREGFGLIASQDPVRYPQIATAALESLASPSDATERRILLQVSENEDAGKQILASATFLAWLVSTRKEELTKILSVAAEAQIIGESAVKPVTLLATLLASDKAQIRQNMERARLGAAVLPSLSEFSVVIDVRLDFEKDMTGPSGEVGLAVPVAVVHLDTDSYNQEAWFQMTRPELENMIDRLQLALDRLKKAEIWVKK